MKDTVNEIDNYELRHALGWPGLCHEEVSRKGQSEPCERVAVALRFDVGNGEGYYPVCSRHARRPFVPLEAIVRFMLDRQEANSLIARGLVQMANTVPVAASTGGTE